VHLLSHHPGDVLGELGKDRAGEVYPAGVCKSLERAGNVELAFDFQQGRVASARFDSPRGVCSRSATSVDAPPLDRARSRRVVISEFGLAAKYRHGRPEFHAHGPLVDTAFAGFGEDGAGNA